MKNQANSYFSDEFIKSYLLGLLPPNEAEVLDLAMFDLENPLFERLLIAEDEIIDDFVGDDLSPEQKAQFELLFLPVPERQEKIRLSRALQKLCREISTEK